MKLYRIFLAIGGKATPGDNNNMWVKNLYDPLISLGHDVYLLNTDDYILQQGLGYMSTQAKELLSNDLPAIFNREHEKKPFDLLFSYLHNAQIFPDVLKEIRKIVFTVNYSTNFHQFEMYKEVAQSVDQNIYVSQVAKDSFDSLGVKSYWMPFAANPAFYKPSSLKNNYSVFIGSVYGQRPYLFWRLLQNHVNLQLYGHGWLSDLKSRNEIISGKVIDNIPSSFKDLIKKVLGKKGYELRKKPESLFVSVTQQAEYLKDELRCSYNELNENILRLLRKDYPDSLHGSLSDVEYVRVLSEAGIVVNIQESRYNHDYFNHRVLFGSNLRDFEVTMCGSLLCTQYSEEIASLFEVGREIVCYYNEHDLAEKIHYYTKHTREKNAIALAGFQKTFRKHTWEKRFEEFFDYLSIHKI